MLIQMIVLLSNSILAQKRSEKVWYVARALIFISGLAFAFCDSKKVAGETRDNSIDAAHSGFSSLLEHPLTQLDIEKLSETALDLKLIGTFTSNTEFSSAVIQTDYAESKRVFLRQSIMDGVTVHTINKKQVIIERGSILETLNLHEVNVVEHIANPHRPSHNQGTAESIAITAPKRAARSGYKNTVEEQRRTRKKRREYYATTED